MKILCLYNNPLAVELFQWLESQGHNTVFWSEKLDSKWCCEQAFDLTVSYTYRYILSRDVLDALVNNAVNLHNSYLPWNRGADPNIWSILEGVPRGVSLHYMDAGLDCGDIIAQRLVTDVDIEDTFESTYTCLDHMAKQLFKESFYYYDFWQGMRKRPKGAGSYHSMSDGEAVKKIMKTYKIKITDFEEDYKRLKLSVNHGGGGKV